MRVPILVLAAAVLPGPAGFAALPTQPGTQRLAELRAVVGHPALAETFTSDAIARIELVRPNYFRVSGARCVLDLQLVWQPQPRGLVGPGTFEMQEAARRCD